MLQGRQDGNWLVLLDEPGFVLVRTRDKTLVEPLPDYQLVVDEQDERLGNFETKGYRRVGLGITWRKDPPRPKAPKGPKGRENSENRTLEKKLGF